MQNLTAASNELFRRSPDECFESLAALDEHCRLRKQASLDRWHPPADLAAVPFSRDYIGKSGGEYRYHDFSWDQEVPHRGGVPREGFLSPMNGPRFSWGGDPILKLSERIGPAVPPNDIMDVSTNPDCSFFTVTEDRGFAQYGGRWTPVVSGYQTVELTSAGKRLVPILAQFADENDREFFGHLKAQERAHVLSVLKAIVEKNDWIELPTT